MFGLRSGHARLHPRQNRPTSLHLLWKQTIDDLLHTIRIMQKIGTAGRQRRCKNRYGFKDRIKNKIKFIELDDTRKLNFDPKQYHFFLSSLITEKLTQCRQNSNGGKILTPRIYWKVFRWEKRIQFEVNFSSYRWFKGIRTGGRFSSGTKYSFETTRPKCDSRCYRLGGTFEQALR